MISLFKKSLDQVMTENLKSFTFENITWFALSVNSTTFKNQILNQQLTLKDHNSTLFQQLSANHHHFGLSQGLSYQGATSIEAQKLAHELMDMAFSWMCEFPKEGLRKTKPEGISEAEELKAKEWLRVSLIVVDKALDDFIKKERAEIDDLVFQCLVFAGHQDAERTAPAQWRILLFQLDIQLIFQNDGGLYCQIFQDRPSGRSSTPALAALFYSQRGPIFDQFVQLINKISVISKNYIFYQNPTTKS